jgi:alanine-glyoxylate transaminase/serine-glyoxylate transaminase/serine-pyruvate transaminase
MAGAPGAEDRGAGVRQASDPHCPQAPNWRQGVQAAQVHDRLRADTAHAIRAVCVVHNETSTGVTSDIAAVRRAIDAAGHPALLMVDTISGLASADYRHDEWGVDVAVSGSQKGLMLPPGISFNALSPTAIEVSKTTKMPRSFWAWDEMHRAMNQVTATGPYTPSTNLLYGLVVKRCDLILGQGLPRGLCTPPALGRRRARGGGAPGACPSQCADPALLFAGADRCHHAAEGVDADARAQAHPRAFRPARWAPGLGKVKGRMFRIGHLGDSNDLTLLAALSGCEMGLKLSGVRLSGSGVLAAMEYFAGQPMAAPSQLAQ